MMPSGWNSLPLGEVVNYKKGFAFKSENFKDSGRRIIRISDTTASSVKNENPVFVSEDNSLQDFELNANDIILSTVGSRPPLYDSMVGKAIKVPSSASGAYLNQNLVKLIPDEKVDHDFLFVKLKEPRFISYISTLVRGNANQVSITLDELFNYQLLLPSKNEQEKIAKILSSWDEAIEVASKLIEWAQTRKSFYLKSIFLPMRNGATELGSFCVFKGGSGFKEKYQGKNSGDYPFIKVSDFNNHGNEKFITNANNWIEKKEQEELKSYLFPAGTVCFAKVGAALLLNKRRVITMPTCMDNNTMGAIPVDGKCLSEFLYQFLLTIDFKEFAQEGALPSVNQGDLSSIEVSFPDISQQQKISDFFSSLDVELRLLNMRKKYFETQKQGLMQQLLTGTKRVKV